MTVIFICLQNNLKANEPSYFNGSCNKYISKRQKFNILISCMRKIKSPTDLSFGDGESSITLLNLYFLSWAPRAFFMLSHLSIHVEWLPQLQLR